jgi:hypothetical protein
VATIKITRVAIRWRDRYRKYRILLDGVRVGALAPGATVTLEVATGKHTLQMQLDWARSAPLTVRVEKGAEIALVCGPNYSAANPIGALLKPSQWIYLDEAR